MFYGIDNGYATNAELAAALGDVTTTQTPDWVWNLAVGDSGPGNMSFVMRYLTNHRGNLNSDEARLLQTNNLRAISIMEEGNNQASTFTDPTGYTQGTRAWQRASDARQPTGMPVYFAVDISTDDTASIQNYFNGVRRSLDDYSSSQGAGGDLYSIGVYGQANILTFCRDNNLATWFWLWGRTDWPGFNVRQLYSEYYTTAHDTTLHYYGDTGHVVGEKFCGLGVDFNIAADLDGAGAWFPVP